MRALVFEPNIPAPQEREIGSKVKDILRAVEGERIQAHCMGNGLMLIYNPKAESPNRVVDGHMVYGTFILCGEGLRSIPRRISKQYWA